MHICMYVHVVKISMYVCMSSCIGKRYVDNETVKRSLFSYNRVIREKYASDSCITDNYETSEVVMSPTNVCELCNSHRSFVDYCYSLVNVHGTADEYSFNDMDELEPISSSSHARSDSVLEPISPSEYLKHQKQAIIAYVDVNIAVDDETHL